MEGGIRILLLCLEVNIHMYFLNCLWFKVISFTDFGKVRVVGVQLSHQLENISPTHLQEK